MDEREVQRIFYGLFAHRAYAAYTMPPVYSFICWEANTRQAISIMDRKPAAGKLNAVHIATQPIIRLRVAPRIL